VQASKRAPRTTSPLDTTPFFRVANVAAGSMGAQISVKAPATLSTYIVRAFAASSNGQVFGVSETEFTVRKQLSLTPSVPRLLRAGDAGTVGVVVTYFGAASKTDPAEVGVTLEVTGVILDSPAKQMLTFSGQGTQREARWNVVAEDVGTVTLIFTGAASMASDALQVDLETLVPQAPVVVASSFPVTANQGWKKGLQVPEAVPGALVGRTYLMHCIEAIILSQKAQALEHEHKERLWHANRPEWCQHVLRSAGTGELSVQAGVGNLPAQLSMARQLLDATPEPPYYTAPWPLSILAMHSVLSQYGDAALQTPVELPAHSARRLGLAKNVSLCVALDAAVPKALQSLKELSSYPDLGLMYFSPRPGWTKPREPDVELNLMVLAPQDPTRVLAPLSLIRQLLMARARCDPL
jgi:Alpha-2-macroglobulin family